MNSSNKAKNSGTEQKIPTFTSSEPKNSDAEKHVQLNTKTVPYINTEV